MDEERNIRAAVDHHWVASDANDFEAEHEIYHADAVLEYPQSGERIRGRRNIQAPRFAQPNKKRFIVRRILGAADLWVTELVLTYDGLPSYTVSIMEFRDGKVARETQYFGDPFEPGASRAQWVERMRSVRYEIEGAKYLVLGSAGHARLLTRVAGPGWHSGAGRNSNNDRYTVQRHRRDRHRTHP